MLRIMAHTPHRLPAHKPRYLMGVGTPEDLVEGVACGVDMFDCVMPTRNARNGHLFTRFGDLKIRNARHKTTSAHRRHLQGCHGTARRLQPRLPAPPGPLRRDAGPHAGQHPQPALLREPDARGARGAGRRPLRGLARAGSTGCSARAACAAGWPRRRCCPACRSRARRPAPPSAARAASPSWRQRACSRRLAFRRCGSCAASSSCSCGSQTITTPSAKRSSASRSAASTRA
jgi:hypothetical protein